MFTSLEEFKFFQSFRIPVEESDNVRCLIEIENEQGKFEYIEDACLADVSVTGIGVISKERVCVGRNLRFSIQFKRIRIDVEGHIVRSFGFELDKEKMLYGVEVDADDQDKMKRFITQYLASFTQDRAKDCLVNLALSERYKSATETFEIFSLMLSLFKDVTSFGSDEKFLESMLEEITRILNAQRGSIFLINPKTNELEAVAALGIDKSQLKFDYRKGIAGSVFTTGVPLNIDTVNDKVRFSEEMDGRTGYETKSIICSPITNREDKVIGVIEVLNKRNEDRFTIEDEKTMKVLALIFSSVFHNYNPMSEKSLIRRFSSPYDREYAFIGRSTFTNNMRKSMVALKDIDTPLFLKGEKGSGKKLLAQIIHNEGKRGLSPFYVVECGGIDHESLEAILFGSPSQKSVFEHTIGGTIVFDNIHFLPLKFQAKLIEVIKNGHVEASKIAIDSRLIFTSSVDIENLCHEQGLFNQELYQFFMASSVDVLPLRQRQEDLVPLLEFFLKKECKEQGLLLKEFSENVIEDLCAYDWPGNVSEIQSAVKKAVLYNPKSHIITKVKKGVTPIVDITKASVKGLDTIPFARDYNIPLKERIALVEREMILAEIKRNKGNKSKAAKAMGISREALRKKLIISDQVLSDLESVEVKKAA